MDNKQRKTATPLSVFDRFSAWFFNTLKNGIFGYFFTSYDKRNAKFLNKDIGSDSEKKSNPNTLKRKFSKKIENSKTVAGLSKFPDFLLCISTRDYGIMMLTMGAVIISLYLIQQYVSFLHIEPYSFIGAIIVTALSLPFLLSSKSISKTILSKKLLSNVLFGFFGMKYERFRIQSEKSKKVLSLFSLLFGILLAVGAYFLSPIKALLILIAVFFAFATLNTPETGVVLLIFILPFANVTALSICMLYIFACYMIKYILGKRTFKFEYFDLWIFIMLIGTLICTFFATNFLSDFRTVSAILIFILSYFVVANLIRSKEWYARCIKAIVSSSAVVALIAIIQFILAKLGNYFDWFERFADFDGNISSLFSSPKVLAQFLAAVIPFVLVYMISIRKDFKTFGGFIVAVLTCAALVLTYNGYAVIGCIVSVLLLLMIFHRNYIYLAFSVLASCPLLYFLLPSEIFESFLADINIIGENTLQRVPFFRSVIDMVKSRPWGYGYSNIPFNSFVEGASTSDANSLYLQIAVSCGALGLLIFVIFTVMLSKLIFSYLVKSRNRYRKINCAAGFCSVVSMLCIGLFDYTWLDKRLMLFFFIAVALSMAYIRIERDIEKPQSKFVDISSASTDIPLSYEAPMVTLPKRRYVRMPKMKKSKTKDVPFYTSEYDTKEFIRIIDNDDKGEENSDEPKEE